MLESLQFLPDGFVIGFVALFGLLVGSFLNVVIYRLPKIIDREQEESVAEFIAQKIEKKEPLEFIRLTSSCPQCQNHFKWSQGIEVTPAEKNSPALAPFNLLTPASACPNCGHKIRWWENIPVFSWLFLRARCSSCHNPISARYPFLELLTGILFGVVAWHFGASIQTVLWCFFVAMCISISGIDWDTTWLPDELSLSLMWAGLIAAQVGWTIPISSAIWGAIAGYMILWTIATLYSKLVGGTAMANGDFKMLAALGAWFGFEFLLPILIVSAFTGAVVGLALKALQSNKGILEGKYIPYGPFLAGAGLIILIFTPQAIIQRFPFLFF